MGAGKRISNDAVEQLPKYRTWWGGMLAQPPITMAIKMPSGSIEYLMVPSGWSSLVSNGGDAACECLDVNPVVPTVAKAA